jgi:hypothetical protein
LASAPISAIARLGNQGIVPAKRKIVAWQSGDCAGQKNTAQQSGNHTYQKIDSGAAFDGIVAAKRK